MGLEGLVASTPTVMPLGAYVDYESGRPIVGVGHSRGEIGRAVRAAQAYRRDLRSVEHSELGDMLSAAARTGGYRAQRIRASGVEDLETRMPGAIQATTYVGKDAIYSRDSRLYRAKLAHMARKHGITDTDLIHRYATIHEYVHGLGVRSEKENHLLVYRALKDAIERGDASKRSEYERLLDVERGELRQRFNIRMEPRTTRRPPSAGGTGHPARSGPRRAASASPSKKSYPTQTIPTRTIPTYRARSFPTIPKRTLATMRKRNLATYSNGARVEPSTKKESKKRSKK